MVGGKAWGTWAQTLTASADRSVDIGLHLDFTECSIDPTNRYAITTLLLKSHAGLLNRSAMRTEIRAQFDKFESLFNRAPAFVDGHLHVHQFPTIRSELINEIKRRYADAKPWIRSTHSRPGTQPPGFSWKQKIKPFVISAAGSSQLLGLLTNQGYRHNQDFAGVYDFAGGEAIFSRNLQHWLGHVAHGGLLMTHPSTGDDSEDSATLARSYEFAVIGHPHFHEWLEKNGIELKAMSQII